MIFSGKLQVRVKTNKKKCRCLKSFVKVYCLSTDNSSNHIEALITTSNTMLPSKSVGFSRDATNSQCNNNYLTLITEALIEPAISI